MITEKIGMVIMLAIGYISNGKSTESLSFTLCFSGIIEGVRLFIEETPLKILGKRQDKNAHS